MPVRAKNWREDLCCRGALTPAGFSDPNLEVHWSVLDEGGGLLGGGPLKGQNFDHAAGPTAVTWEWDGTYLDATGYDPSNPPSTLPKKTLGPGSYKVEISVTARESSDPAKTVTVKKLEDITVNGASALTIFKGESEKIAVSTLVPAGKQESPELLAARRTLLQKIQPVDGLPWKIKATGLSFEGTAPPTVILRVHSTLSDVTKSVTLTGIGGNYEGNFTVTSALRDDPEPILRELASTGTTFTTSDVPTVDLRDFTVIELATTFRERVLNGTRSDVYPSPHRELGRYVKDTAKLESQDLENPEMAPLDENNFGAGGLEGLTFQFDSPTLKNGPAKALVKVANPSKVQFHNLHGDHNGDLEDHFLKKFFPTRMAFQRLKTLILGSCQALDLHDYNNYYSSPFAARSYPSEYHSRLAPLSERHFGGERWYAATGSGQVTLLGYGGVVYFQGLRSALIAYGFELGSNASEPEAWIRANLLSSTGTDLAWWSNANACAYDKDAYYCVSYPVPQITDQTIPLPKPLEGLSAYRVPKANWDKERENWDDQNLDDIATPF